MTGSVRFLETIVEELFVCGTANEVMSECFELVSISDSFMSAVLKQNLTNSLFTLR